MKPLDVTYYFDPGDRVRVRLKWECPLAHDGETPSHLPTGHHIAADGVCGTVDRIISPDIGWVGHRVVVRLDKPRSPVGTEMYTAAELEPVLPVGTGSSSVKQCAYENKSCAAVCDERGQPRRPTQWGTDVPGSVRLPDVSLATGHDR